MRSALTEDANAAARTVLPVTKDMSNNDNETLSEVTCSTNNDKEGVFVGGLPFKRLSDLNLKGMADADKAAGSSVEGHSEEAVAERRDRLDSLSSIFSSGNVTSMRKFSFDASVLESSMKPSTSMSSFVELFTPDLRPMKPPSRRTSDIDAQPIVLGGVAKNDEIEIPAARDRAESVVDSIIDEAIDSVLESSTAERDFQGLFLKEISKFLIEADSPFQHVDLWVPMDVSHSDLVGEKHIGGSSTMATTSSNRVTGIIYGGQQASSVRLSHAGYITVGSTPQVVNSLNEVSTYQFISKELFLMDTFLNSFTLSLKSSLACIARIFHSPLDLVYQAVSTFPGLLLGKIICVSWSQSSLHELVVPKFMESTLH